MISTFSKARYHRGFTLLELLVVASIIAIIAAIAIPQLLNAKRSAWEARAKTTLRAYGETQLAYQNTNNDHHWGSWVSLKATDYLAQGYNRANIIENYSVWTNVVNVSDMDSSIGSPTGVGDNTFTVVAFPRTTSPPGYLSTFIIREDEVLRVYRPSTGSTAWGLGGDFGGRTWEPIR